MRPEWDGRTVAYQQPTTYADEVRWTDRGGGFLVGLVLGLIVMAWLSKK